jgi:hypothetical protein
MVDTLTAYELTNTELLQEIYKTKHATVCLPNYYEHLVIELMRRRRTLTNPCALCNKWVHLDNSLGYCDADIICNEGILYQAQQIVLED